MGFRAILTYVFKELKSFTSDKTSIFWVVIWPLIWIILVAYVFVPPGTVAPVSIDVGVVNLDTSPPKDLNFTSFDFIKILNTTTYNGSRLFNVELYNGTESVVEDLRSGRIDVGIVIPENFSSRLMFGIANLRVLIGGGDPHSSSINYAVINMFLNEFSRRIALAKANVSISYIELGFKHIYGNMSTQQLIDFAKGFIYSIATPLNLSYEEIKPEIYSSRPNMLGWYTVGAIGMMFLYTGFSYGASALYEEKERGTLRRILASPVKPSELVAGIVLSSLATMIISAVIALIVGLLLGAHIIFNPLNPLHWITITLLFVGAFMSIGIGILLSTLARTSQGASGLGTTLGILLTFLTGIWFPRTWMPQWLQILAEASPATWVFDTIRSILVFNAGFEGIGSSLIKILVATATILILDIAVYKYRLRRYIEEA